MALRQHPSVQDAPDENALSVLAVAGLRCEGRRGLWGAIDCWPCEEVSAGTHSRSDRSTQNREDDGEEVGIVAATVLRLYASSNARAGTRTDAGTGQPGEKLPRQLNQSHFLLPVHQPVRDWDKEKCLCLGACQRILVRCDETADGGAMLRGDSDQGSRLNGLYLRPIRSCLRLCRGR